MAVRSVWLVAALVVTYVLGGCSLGEPSVDEVAPVLRTDAERAIAELEEELAPPAAEPRTVADGTKNRGCAEGGVRRKYQAWFPLDTRRGELDDVLDGVSNSVVAHFVAEGDYALQSLPDSDALDVREWLMANEAETITFTVRATGTPSARITVLGTTACLDR